MIGESGSQILKTPTAPCGPALRLTASHARQSGAVWYARKQQVREGFETTFTFRLANPSRRCKRMDDVYTHCRSRGADGFAFVVQNQHKYALGRAGAYRERRVALRPHWWGSSRSRCPAVLSRRRSRHGVDSLLRVVPLVRGGRWCAWRGVAGMGLGYDGIANSVAVEFDTWCVLRRGPRRRPFCIE